jgi:hypothetical protein
MSGCIFCGSPDLSREHIFSQSKLAERFPGTTHAHLVVERVLVGEERPVHAWESPKQQLVVKCVCRKCNNGWMNGLDDNAYPILFELMDAEARDVTPTERTTLAAWATKISAMIERTSSEESRIPVLAAEDAQRLMHHRLPPDRAWVWLASTDYSRATDKNLLLIVAWTVVLHGERMEADILHITTFRINNLVFQVFVPHAPPVWVPPGSKPQRPHLSSDWFPLLQSIWPPSYFVLNWPPNFRITSEAKVHALADAYG